MYLFAKHCKNSNVDKYMFKDKILNKISHLKKNIPKTDEKEKIYLIRYAKFVQEFSFLENIKIGNFPLLMVSETHSF